MLGFMTAYDMLFAFWPFLRIVKSCPLLWTCVRHLLYHRSFRNHLPRDVFRLQVWNDSRGLFGKNGVSVWLTNIPPLTSLPLPTVTWYSPPSEYRSCCFSPPKVKVPRIHRAPDFFTAESGKNFNSKKCCICMCLHKISFIFHTCSRCVYKYFSGPNGRTGWANLDPILGGIRPVIWAHADNVQFPNTVAALQLPWQAEASQAIWSFLSSKRRWTPYWSILMACWF